MYPGTPIIIEHIVQKYSSWVSIGPPMLCTKNQLVQVLCIFYVLLYLILFSMIVIFGMCINYWVWQLLNWIVSIYFYNCCKVNVCTLRPPHWATCTLVFMVLLAWVNVKTYYSILSQVWVFVVWSLFLISITQVLLSDFV